MFTLLSSLLSGGILPVSLMNALPFKNVWGIICIVGIVVFIGGFFVFKKMAEEKTDTDDEPTSVAENIPSQTKDSLVQRPEVPTVLLPPHVIPVEVVSIVDLMRHNHVLSPGKYPYIVGSHNNMLLGIRVWHGFVICPPIEKKVSYEECLEFSMSQRKLEFSKFQRKFLNLEDMKYLKNKWEETCYLFRRCNVRLEPGIYWFEDENKSERKERLRGISLPDGKVLSEDEQETEAKNGFILLSKY